MATSFDFLSISSCSSAVGVGCASWIAATSLVSVVLGIGLVDGVEIRTPALKASVRMLLFASGMFGIRPDKAWTASAAWNEAMPPIFGWFVCVTIFGRSSKICSANKARARLGPTSTKRRAPLAYIVSICFVHSTVEAI